MRSGFTRYFIAVILIAFGTLLILDNIGIYKTDLKSAWYIIYPTFFVFMGLKLLIDYFKKNGSGWILGSFLLIFGTLLLLGEFNIIQYQFSDIFKLWPLLIIYFGFSIVGKSRHKKYPRVKILQEDYTNGAYWKNMYGGKYWQNFSVGNYEYKEPNWKVEPMNLKKTAGNFYIDFTKAFIPQEDIPISIRSLAGDVQILMPENVEFSVEASLKAGEINILGQTADGINRDMQYKSTGYDEAEQKLTIRINLKAGSVRVDRI